MEFLKEGKLWELRQEIALNSIYYSDYENSFGIETHSCCDFFDGYLDSLEDLMQDDMKEKYNDENFFEYLKEYDTSDNLYEWYGCFEENPLIKL